MYILLAHQHRNYKNQLRFMLLVRKQLVDQHNYLVYTMFK